MTSMWLVLGLLSSAVGGVLLGRFVVSWDRASERPPWTDWEASQ